LVNSHDIFLQIQALHCEFAEFLLHVGVFAQTKEIAVPQKPQTSTIGSPEDDLTLRASMYGVLFQSFADKVRS
jgi:hypothetical protein